MNCFPTISDCTDGAVLVFGRWYSREECPFPRYYCGCGCREWVEPCFFCKKPTLSSEAVFAEKRPDGGNYRFSCQPCSLDRNPISIPASYTP